MRGHMKCLVCSADIYKRLMKYPVCSKECREKRKLKRCERCGKEYKTKEVKSAKRFCSPECGYKSRRKPRMNCAFCGKSTGRPLNRDLQNSFCTPKCQADFYHPPKTKLCTQCFGKKGGCKCSRIRKSKDPWDRAVVKQRGIAGHKMSGYQKDSQDPWYKKINSVIAGHRNRIIRPGVRREGSAVSGWGESIDAARRKAMSKHRREARAMADPWWIKCLTVESNWRRKANAKQGNKHSTERPLGSTELSLCAVRQKA